MGIDKHSIIYQQLQKHADSFIALEIPYSSPI